MSTQQPKMSLLKSPLALAGGAIFLMVLLTTAFARHQRYSGYRHDAQPALAALERIDAAATGNVDIRKFVTEFAKNRAEIEKFLAAYQGSPWAESPSYRSIKAAWSAYATSYPLLQLEQRATGRVREGYRRNREKVSNAAHAAVMKAKGSL